MAVYKFKVVYEDHEDIYREIEIKSNQTFEDLHHAIQKAINFDNGHSASFYMSDDYWRKGTEITLKKDDLTGVGPNKKPKKLMASSKVADFIEDPHQKIVYVFDFKAHWTFQLELTKISLDDPKTDFPRCVKSVGKAPIQYKKNALPVPDAEHDDDEDVKTKEKIFTSEEGYDQPDEEDDDVLTEGDEETEEGENGEEAEFGDGLDHEEEI